MKIQNQDLELSLSKIEKLIRSSSTPVLVALDGRSGTGKTSLAKEIAQRLGGVEILADNFWAGGSNEEWDKRSPQEKSDKAIDWRRLKSEVLEPLLAGKGAKWHSFDWKKGGGLSLETIECPPIKLIVLDGAYSSRPELQDIINISILVEIPSDAERRKRLLNRENKEYMDDWHKRWDSAEDYYFYTVRPRDSFDLIIQNH